MTAAQKAFGQIVRERREELGMNQRQLARQIPASLLVVFNIENGTFTPPAEVLNQLAEALKTDVSALTTRATLLSDIIQRGKISS